MLNAPFMGSSLNPRGSLEVPKTLEPPLKVEYSPLRLLQKLKVGIGEVCQMLNAPFTGSSLNPRGSLEVPKNY